MDYTFFQGLLADIDHAMELLTHLYQKNQITAKFLIIAIC